VTALAKTVNRLETTLESEYGINRIKLAEMKINWHARKPMEQVDSTEIRNL
jgi:hypothetical protein